MTLISSRSAFTFAALVGWAGWACQSEAPQSEPGADLTDVMIGGQSGGEGSAPDDQPCACLVTPVIGRITSIGDGCARVEVLATPDENAEFSEFEVGQILGGVLAPACRGSGPFVPGDQILFEFHPGDPEPCLERRQCLDACPAGEQGEECAASCEASAFDSCSSPEQWSLSTGRFSAVKLNDAVGTFYFAGQQRSATLDELLSPSCWTDQQALVFSEPSAGGAPAEVNTAARDSGGLAPPETPDPASCWDAKATTP